MNTKKLIRKIPKYIDKGISSGTFSRAYKVYKNPSTKAVLMFVANEFSPKIDRCISNKIQKRRSLNAS